MFERWYRRDRARYPREVLGVLLRLPHVFFLLAVAVVELYIPMSPGEFAVLALAAMASQGLYNALTLRHLGRHLEPAVDWLSGGRDAEGSAEAWRSTASVPYEILRLWLRGGYPIVAVLLWASVAVWVLELPLSALPLVFASAVVGTVYVNAFVFFVIERAIRPVIDELAAHLSVAADPTAASLPLRRRLLIALPALNVITGVVAIGLAEPGGGVAGLAEALGLSLAVALTFTFVLSLLLAASVVGPVDRLGAATRRVADGDLATRVPVAADDEMGQLTRAFNRMVEGLQERERLREAFGIFVDPGLAERVARDGTDLRGEEVDLTVLFMDVRGFTAFAERAEAAEVVARLNELFEEVVPVILRHGGHANKFVGDGLMAVFGAPERLADHAELALAAARGITAAVGERFGDGLRVGVGINSGPAVVGTVGGGGRLDFTVIGDTVNTAARVESATRQTEYGVLLTGATYDRLSRSRDTLVERPALELKGKSEAVRLYAIPIS